MKVHDFRSYRVSYTIPYPIQSQYILTIEGHTRVIRSIEDYNNLPYSYSKGYRVYAILYR